MANTKRYDAYIAQERAKGVHPHMAALDPEARRAYQLDLAEAAEQERTQTNWPTEKDHFVDREEFQAAMADRAYKVNPHYRARVEQLLAHSPHVFNEQISGYSQGVQNFSDETFVAQVKRDAEVQATKDAFKAAKDNPLALAAIVEKIQADREGSDRIESHFTSEGPLQRASRLAGFIRTGSDLGKAMAGDDAKPSAENMGEGDKR